MRVERVRDNVYSLTATRQEMGALVAAARMAVDVMRADPSAPPQAIALVESVLADWDRSLGAPGGDAPPPPGSGG
jgi:hypothetical protein